MKIRRMLAALLALVFVLAAAPAGAEKSDKAVSPSTDVRLLDEERRPDEEKMNAIIDFTERANDMIKRTSPLTKRSGDPVYGDARLIVYSSDKPEIGGALDCVRGYDGRWLVQYASPEEARAAFERLNADETVDNVFADAKVSMCHVPGEDDFVSYGYDYFRSDLLTFDNWMKNSGLGYYVNTVAVIDTGVAGSHPLFSNMMVTGYDFVNSDSDASDDQGHGTHVAGIIAQGVYGVRIMPLKVLGSDGFGNTNNVISAMDYATAANCSIMNLSLSRRTDNPSTDTDWQNAKEREATAIDNAFDNGTIVVVAAGNDAGDVANNIPASVERALTVAGHNSSYGWYVNSNRGEEVDVNAPAVDIYSANYLYGGTNQPKYVKKTGTSMATPHVAAACALARCRYIHLDADAVVRMIKESTIDYNLSGGGTGALSIAKLVRQLSASRLPQTAPSEAIRSAMTSNTNAKFVSGGQYPAFAETSNGTTYVRSGNAGKNNSISAVSTVMYLYFGTQISFDYCCESETNYDFFDFSVNGENLLHLSGTSSSFQTASFTLENASTCELKWTFTKDSSNSYGFDGFKIRNLRFTGTAPICQEYHIPNPAIGAQYYLNKAANCDMRDFFITSAGDHPFAAVDANGPYSYVKSGNSGVHNSVSELKFTAYLEAGQTITYNRAVSSEQNYDRLTVLVNGAENTVLSGDQSWANGSYTAPSTGNYSFVFRYSKDSSQSKLDDVALINNIRIGSQPTLNEALNYGSTERIAFETSSDYPFTVDRVGSDDVGVSRSSGENGSETWIKCRVQMYAGDILRFEYYYSTEENYDIFSFKANGENVFQFSGEDNTWHDWEFTAYTTGIFTFEWVYKKDSSTSNGYDCIAIDNVRYVEAQDQTYSLDYSLNAPGGGLHFTASRFWADFWYSDPIGTSSTMGENASESTVSTTVFMNPGDVLQFEYYVSSEENYDWYTFTANGTQIQRLSGDLGWSMFEYTAESAGNYTFVWKYTKDNSMSKYMDTIKLDNVDIISGEYDLEVINDDDSNAWLGFTSTGSYPFRAYRQSNGTYYATSTNRDVDSSSSVMSTTVSLSAGDMLSFYYIVSSEEVYDEFQFLVNNSIVLCDSGESGIQLYTYTAPTSRSYTFTWKYVKDGDRSYGDDSVKIMAVKVSSGYGFLPGDADRNGTVDSTDALLILRCALGISGDSNYYKVNCDMDGNGVIDTTDALIILRMALGIS